MLLQAAASNIVTGLQFPLHCTRRPLPGEPPRLRRGHPDLRNKAAEQKLTFVRMPGSHRCFSTALQMCSSAQQQKQRVLRQPCRKACQTIGAETLLKKRPTLADDTSHAPGTPL